MADGQNPYLPDMTSSGPNPGLTEADNAGLLVSEQPVGLLTVSTLQVPQASESVYIPSNATLSVGYSCSSYGASWKGVEFVGGRSVRPKTRRCRDVSVHMVLACVTFWLFGFVFGFVAYLLELRAAQKLASGDVDDRKETRKLRRASLIVSVVGIVVGVTVIIVAVVTTLNRPTDEYNYVPGRCNEHEIDPEYDGCLQRPVTKFQSNTPSPETHPNLTLRIRPATRCQPTASTQGFILPNQYVYTYTGTDTYPYFVNGKCYQNAERKSCGSCIALNGAFRNGLCYTNNRVYYDGCTPGTPCFNGECYSSRQISSDGTCPVGQVYSDGYCYHTPLPDCNDGYFVDCTCYRKKTRNFTSSTCTNIGGYYVGDRSYVYHLPNGTSALADTNTCYYNSFECRGYVVNGQCYLTATHDYTAGTCRLIGGYMDTDTCTCYNSGFACESPYYQRIGQCFVSDIDIASCTSCLNIGGYPVLNEVRGNFYDADYFYHSPDRPMALRCYLHNNFTFNNATLSSCPYYAVNTTRGPLCETHMTTAFNESECDDKGGTYIDNHCYYTPTECEDFLYNCTCYKYRSTAYDNDDCTNIGGAFDFRRNVCYYNSATCVYYTFNGKCYRYRNTHTQAEYCRGVYDGLYGYCYTNN